MSPVSSDSTVQDFVVKEGEGASVIADKLAQAKLIRSDFAFKLELKLTGDASKLIPGDFNIAPNMTVSEVIQTLSQAPDDKKVTLLEGWRDEEVAEKLNTELGINTEDFLKQAKQGYMFPDSYQFDQKTTVADVVTTLRNNFDQKYTPELQSQIKALGLTPDQGVILASIVEREARTDSVRQKVASILLKRFKIGMALDVDSTLQYILGYSKEEGTWWRSAISDDDKKINSSYNTYLNAGLPPTPICNPSLSSLEAVAAADPSTPYLYYYHDSKGNSYYAKTLDEHNANVANHP